MPIDEIETKLNQKKDIKKKTNKQSTIKRMRTGFNIKIK